MSKPPQQVEYESFTFSGKGEVCSFTTVKYAGKKFERQTPYVLALIRLDEGPIITAQLTDNIDENNSFESVNIGDRVEMVTRRLFEESREGIIVYGYKFRKILNQSESKL